jgi:diguanylate cyclase (GGDEF)-like protein
MRRFLTPLCLYLIGCTVAWLSNLFGHTTLPRTGGGLLLWGIGATNLLFLLVARTKTAYRPSETAVTLAQCVIGISWITLYALLKSGSGELVLGMYLTTILFAASRLGRRTLSHLAIFSAGCYAVVVFANSVLKFGDPLVWAEGMQLVIYLGVLTWLLSFGHRLRFLGKQSIDSGPSRSVADHMEQAAENEYQRKSFNQRYIMETLAREKGRTDRSNTPFSICIFDIDSFSTLIEEQGSLTADRVLKEFSKRVRNELRGMDTMNPTGIERVFGQFSNEEFVVILPHTGLAGADRCANRISARVSQKPFDSEHHLTVSVGITEHRRGESISELLARAEQALHDAMSNDGISVRKPAEEPPKTAEVIELHKLKK